MQTLPEFQAAVTNMVVNMLDYCVISDTTYLLVESDGVWMMSDDDVKMYKVSDETWIVAPSKIEIACRDPEAFRKYCLRYGTVKSSEAWEDLENMPCRKYVMEIDGMLANIEMKLGRVVKHGYVCIP